MVTFLAIMYAAMTAAFWLAVMVAGFFAVKAARAILFSIRPGMERKTRI